MDLSLVSMGLRPFHTKKNLLFGMKPGSPIYFFVISNNVQNFLLLGQK